MRIFYMAGFLSLVLALSMSLAAQTPATSAQQPSAMPSQGTTGQGATTPGATQSTPSQAPSGQTSTTPGTTPSTSQPPAQAEEENPLNLTEEQKTKLRPILMDERQQMEAVRSDTSMSAEQKLAKVQQIRQTASPKIKAVLTPEQLKKLADMQQAQQGTQSAPATSTPPQK